MKLILSALLLSFLVVKVVDSGYLEVRKSVITPPVSECMCATGVDPFIVQDWYDNIIYPNDACFKCFLRCLGIFIGEVDSAGTIYEDVYVKKLEVPIELVQNCSAQVATITDLCQKFYDHITCIVYTYLKRN